MDRNFYKRVGKSAFAFALLGWLVHKVPFRDIIGAFEHLTVGSIVLLMLWSALLIYVSSLKWHYFLRALGTRMPVLKLFNLYLVGYFVNLAFPSYIGGDAVRSWYAGKRSGQHEAATATILERYTGLTAMVFLALLCMWFVSFVTWQIKVTVVFIACGLVVATGLALSPRLLALMDRLPRADLLTRHLRKIQAGFRLTSSDKKLLFKAYLLSFAYHTFTIGNTVAAAWAVGWWDPPVGDLFVVVPLILLIGAVPLTPGGLGIQEGAFYYFLHQLGATPAQAVGVALVLRAKGYILALLGGLAWLAVRKEFRHEQD